MTKKEELATGELPAILGTVASIGILPSALEAKFSETWGGDFIRVYLPYPLHYEDISSIYRGIPPDPLAIQERLDASNKQIEKVLHDQLGDQRWGHVYPPLARLLGDPAFDYTKAMLKHPEVKDQLDKLR
jgi:hypothetical protein